MVLPTPVPVIEIPEPAVRVVKKDPVEPICKKLDECKPSNKSELRLVTKLVEPTETKVPPMVKLPVILPLPTT
jgi:hypothetical protein